MNNFNNKNVYQKLNFYIFKKCKTKNISKFEKKYMKAYY